MLLVVYFFDVPEVTTLLALGALEPLEESEDFFPKNIYYQLMGIINVCNLVDFEIVLPLKYLITMVLSILFGGRGNLLPSMAHEVAIN